VDNRSEKVSVKRFVSLKSQLFDDFSEKITQKREMLYHLSAKYIIFCSFFFLLFNKFKDFLKK